MSEPTTETMPDALRRWIDKFIDSYPESLGIKGALVEEASYSGRLLTDILATETLSNGNAVFINSSGLWERADATEFAAHGIFVGIDDVTVGEVATVLIHGTVRRSAWSWTPGNSIYLTNTPGEISHTAPIAPDLIQRIGYAITDKIAYFDFNSAVS